MVIFVLIFANEFTRILTGGNNPSTVLNMRIISGILLVGTVNNVLGVLGMINLGMEPQFRNSILFCGAFNLLASSLGAYYLLDVGAALSLLATETLLAGTLYIQLSKKLAHD
jgi:PST family polysaccharide transporter